jgi:hypothetical protein
VNIASSSTIPNQKLFTPVLQELELGYRHKVEESAVSGLELEQRQ